MKGVTYPVRPNLPFLSYVVFMLIVSAPFAVAQSYNIRDTVFYDENYRHVTERPAATYYREPGIEAEAHYKVSYHFYPGHEVAFTGFYKPVETMNGMSIEPSDAIKDGPFVFYFKHGAIAHEGTFRMDIPDGEWRYYSNKTANSLTEKKIFSKEGIIDTTYYKNGQAATAQYKKNIGKLVRDGFYRSYYPNGLPMLDIPYKLGSRSGYCTFRDSLGNVEYEGDFVNGQRSGVWKYYYTGTTKLREELVYDQGNLSGVYKMWDSTGKILREGKFVNGQREGSWKYYNAKTGKLLKEMEYRRNLPVGNYREYDDSLGKIVVEGKFDKKGERIGTWKIFEPNSGLQNGEIVYNENNGRALYYSAVTNKITLSGSFEGADPVGEWVQYYAGTDKKANIKHYERKRLHGDILYFDTLGYVRFKIPFFYGVIFGKQIDYYPYSDKVWVETELLNGKRNGTQKVYYRDGKLKREATCYNGKVNTEKCYDYIGTEIKCQPFYTEASCAEDISTYVGNNLRYPPEAKAAGIEGKVEVSFLVNEDGKLSDIAVQKGFDKNCDEEAIRLVEEMPEWAPAMLDGVPVISSEHITVVFWLDKEETLKDE